MGSTADQGTKIPHALEQLTPCATTSPYAVVTQPTETQRTKQRKNCLWTHACLIISQQNLKIECESTSQDSLGWELLSLYLLWNIPFIPPLHQFLWQSPPSPHRCVPGVKATTVPLTSRSSLPLGGPSCCEERSELLMQLFGCKM